jgi:hypothetical protein
MTVAVTEYSSVPRNAVVDEELGGRCDAICVDVTVTYPAGGLIGDAWPRIARSSVTSRIVERSLHRRFYELADRWRKERGHTSKIRDLAVNSAYQQIIGMGEVAVPFLLEEMRTRPDQWTWALRAITGVNPVPEQARGKLREIAAAWVNWGIERGYIQ